jgi:prepilin peptidase CpaA
MTTYGLIMSAPMVALLAWAAVSDWSARRIPNWLTFTLALSGLLQGFTGGAAGVGFRGAALGLFVGFSLTFIYFALGAMCGGDVKLMAGVGAWLGPWGALQVFLAEAIIGAAMALVQAVVQGRLRTVLQNTAVLAGTMAAGAGDGGLTALGAIDSAAADAPVDKRWLPYSLPVLAATAVVLAVRWSR